MIHVTADDAAEYAEIARRHDFAPLFGSSYQVRIKDGTLPAFVASRSVTVAFTVTNGKPRWAGGGGKR